MGADSRCFMLYASLFFVVDTKVNNIKNLCNSYF